MAAWQDTPADAAWTSPDAGDVLRGLDRFQPIPDVPARAGVVDRVALLQRAGRHDPVLLTFLVGPLDEQGRRVAGVRLQLDREGQVTSYGDAARLDPDEVLATAPELTIGRSRVRIDGDRYVVSFDLAGDARAGARARRDARRPARLAGRGRGGADRASRPHAAAVAIRGARGWVSGYVVPVMSGALDGAIRVGPTTVSLAGGTGYHDHNWGFWEGVSWQWGQVQHEGLSCSTAACSRRPTRLTPAGSPDS